MPGVESGVREERAGLLGDTTCTFEKGILVGRTRQVPASPQIDTFGFQELPTSGATIEGVGCPLVGKCASCPSRLANGGKGSASEILVRSYRNVADWLTLRVIDFRNRFS